jgi:hypothetical protein
VVVHGMIGMMMSGSQMSLSRLTYALVALFG